MLYICVQHNIRTRRDLVKHTSAIHHSIRVSGSVEINDFASPKSLHPLENIMSNIVIIADKMVYH